MHKHKLRGKESIRQKGREEEQEKKKGYLCELDSAACKQQKRIRQVHTGFHDDMLALCRVRP